jgi:hypothetical protein
MGNIPGNWVVNAWVVIPALPPVKKQEKAAALKKGPPLVFIKRHFLLYKSAEIR